MIEFLFLGFLAVFLAYRSQFEKNNATLVWAFVIIWYVASFQDCIGIDFASYKDGFNDILSGRRSYSLFRFDREDAELGWYFLCKIMGGIFGTFYAVTPIAYAVILYPIYKLIKLVNPRWRWIVVFYFFFGVKYFLLDMSAIRQGMSITFWILLVFALKEKKWWRSAIYVFLGIAFHNSFLYSLVLVPLALIPYDRIDFSRYKWLIVVGSIALFTVGLLYVSVLVETIQSAYVLLESSQFEGTYSAYITEVEVHDRSISGFLSGLLTLVFVVVAFVSKRDSIKDCNVYFVLFILIFILDSSVGGFGSLPRMLRYAGFFALPAIAYTVDGLKGIMRHAFIIFILFLTMYTFFRSIQTDQYLAYQHYHTIFYTLLTQ